MKRKILTIIVIGSIFCMMLSGCGIKDNPVTASADTNIIDGKLLEGLNEKVIEAVGDVKTQLEEHEEEASSSYDPVTGPTLKEMQEMITEKVPEGLVEIVTDDVTEEYNRKLKEKEEGIFYVPEEIFSKYNVAVSDADIIEITNERQFEFHNELRESLGLPLFERDEKLDEVADIRSEEISYFFSHNRPNGESVLGILSTLEMPRFGENIGMAACYEPYEDWYFFSNVVFDGLCNSPGHYANMTDKHFKKIGIDSYVIHYEDGVIAVYTAFEFGSIE